MTRLASAGLMVLNLLTVGLLLIPLVTSLAVSLTPSEFIALPTDGISLRWYEQFFGDFRWISALLNTLLVAGLTMAISFPVGLLAAVAFTRYHLRWRPVATTRPWRRRCSLSVGRGTGSAARVHFREMESTRTSRRSSIAAVPRLRSG